MSTQTSLPELQSAFYARLTGDTTLMALVTGVFDYGSVPQNQPYPFISIGDSTEGPQNAFGTRGYISTLTLHIWDNSNGFKTCQSILANMNRLLDQQIVSLATLKHVYTLYNFSQTLNDPGTNNIKHMPVRYATFSQEVTGLTTQDVNLLQVNGTAVSPSNPVPTSGPVTIVDGGDVTQGSMADVAWSGTGSATQIAILKKIVAYLASTLTVNGTITEANSAAILAALDGGQETMTNSLSVVIASDQSAIPISGTITETNSSTINTHLANIDSDSASLVTNTTGLATQTTLSAAKTNLDTIVTNTNKIPASPAQEGGNLGTLAGIVSNNKAAVNIAQIAGSAISNTNPVPVQDIEQVGYIALTTPPTNTNAASDTQLTFSSQVNRVILQNNYSATIYFDFDQAASLSSFQLQPGAFLSYPKKCTSPHIYTVSAVPLNAANGLLVRGAL